MLEGPKVLFRFSLAILKLHEKDILKKTDTMGIMKHLKSCAKLTYDVDGLVKVSGNKTFHLKLVMLNILCTTLSPLLSC